MAPAPGDRGDPQQWRTLDKDLKRIALLENAALYLGRGLVGWGVSLALLLLAGLTAAAFFGPGPGGAAVIAAAVFAAYMAMNIGANDVANNMGPAVGARVLPMAAAVGLAALAETAGALLGGRAVVETVSSGIVDPRALAAPQLMVRAMLAALIAAALWINCATLLRAPVSTTHAIVGGVMGAGIAAAGLGAVNWAVAGRIAAFWVISPLAGGALAAMLLAFIRWRILEAPDRLAAARRWVPRLAGLMAGAFTAYLGLKLDFAPLPSAALGAGAALLAWGISVPRVALQSRGMEDRKAHIKRLFGLPLALAATGLSFAHGANDVANAAGPLAAVVSAAGGMSPGGLVPVPVWAIAIGALGISTGLLLYGPRLIRMVGSQITRLNPLRAFCIALSATITVLLASTLGLPVSTTHVSIGGVFGVGFFREWEAARAVRARAEARHIPPEEQRRRRLVRRSHFLTIIAAWGLTVPAAALLSALVFALLGPAFG